MDVCRTPEQTVWAPLHSLLKQFERFSFKEDHQESFTWLKQLLKLSVLLSCLYLVGPVMVRPCRYEETYRRHNFIVAEAAPHIGFSVKFALAARVCHPASSLEV